MAWHGEGNRRIRSWSLTTIPCSQILPIAFIAINRDEIYRCTRPESILRIRKDLVQQVHTFTRVSSDENNRNILVLSKVTRVQEIEIVKCPFERSVILFRTTLNRFEGGDEMGEVRSAIKCIFKVNSPRSVLILLQPSKEVTE